MNSKHKPYHLLSLRQKRRRVYMQRRALEAERGALQYVVECGSSSDERLVEEDVQQSPSQYEVTNDSPIPSETTDQLEQPENNTEFISISAFEEYFKETQLSLQNLHTQVAQLTSQNNKILKLLEKFEKKPSEKEAFSDGLYKLDGFPLDTVEKFKAFDCPNNVKKRQELFSYLIRLGGVSLRGFLNCALKQTMTDELVCSYTWKKQGDTEEFGNTRIANVIYQAALKCTHFSGPRDISEFKDHILEVFRSAKQRFRNANKKNQSDDVYVLKDTIIKNEVFEIGDESYICE